VAARIERERVEGPAANWRATVSADTVHSTPGLWRLGLRGREGWPGALPRPSKRDEISFLILRLD
jgi:hypothetical protein